MLYRYLVTYQLRVDFRRFLIQNHILSPLPIETAAAEPIIGKGMR